MVWASYIFLTVAAAAAAVVVVVVVGGSNVVVAVVVLVVVAVLVVVVVVVVVVDDIILGINFIRKHPIFQSTNSFLYKKFYHSPPWVLMRFYFCSILKTTTSPPIRFIKFIRLLNSFTFTCLILKCVYEQ